MSRIVIKDDENLSAGAGVEGRRQKKSSDTTIDNETGKEMKNKNFGSLKFDAKKNVDLFDSGSR